MLAKIKNEYRANGGDVNRSNTYYGYVPKKETVA